MTASPIRLALVGSGRIGTHHARAIARAAIVSVQENRSVTLEEVAR